jgi:hypothetical protein
VRSKKPSEGSRWRGGRGGLMQIKWGEAEGLKLAGVGMEGGGGRGAFGSENRQSKTVCKRSGSTDREQGERGRSAVNRQSCSRCGRAGRSSDQQWWRTELDLSSGKSFDDRHRCATLEAPPKRFRLLGSGGLLVAGGLSWVFMVGRVEEVSWKSEQRGAPVAAAASV